MKSQVEAYKRYLEICEIRSNPVLSSLEELIPKEQLYETLEFSIKFKKQNGPIIANPQRFSLWKYQFDPAKHRDFFHEALDCFEKISGKDSTEPFRKLDLHDSFSEIRYAAFGTEIQAEELNRTRLKLYVGYKQKRQPFLPYILRYETNLNGHAAVTRYDGYPMEWIRKGKILGYLPKRIRQQASLFFVYKQEDKLHFKVQPPGTHVLDLIKEMTNDHPSILNPIAQLLENRFQIRVVTFSMQELLKNDIQNLTVYFRDQDATFARDDQELGA